MLHMGVWKTVLSTVAVGMAIWYISLTGGHIYQKPYTRAYSLICNFTSKTVSWWNTQVSA